MKNVVNWSVLKSLKIIGWTFIVLWIPFVMFLGSNGMLPGYNVENTAQIMLMWLLIPITLISIPLTYTFNLSHYTKKKSALQVSVWTRILLSVFMTSIILVLSWYLYMFLSVVLHFRFNI